MMKNGSDRVTQYVGSLYLYLASMANKRERDTRFNICELGFHI